MKSNFKKGDMVEAIVKIIRRDRKFSMIPGDVAEVKRVYEGEEYQILAVETKSGDRMIDICCSEEAPFKKHD